MISQLNSPQNVGPRDLPLVRQRLDPQVILISAGIIILAPQCVLKGFLDPQRVLKHNAVRPLPHPQGVVQAESVPLLDPQSVTKAVAATLLNPQRVLQGAAPGEVVGVEVVAGVGQAALSEPVVSLGRFLLRPANSEDVPVETGWLWFLHGHA